MKILKLALAVVLIGGLTALAYYVAVRMEHAIREVTISVLRQIPQSFLVLQTDEQLAMATVSDGGWILGPRIGQATATTRVHWGCDLGTIKPEDLDVAGLRVRVRLPNPAVLDTAIDPSSLRIFSKRSGLQVLCDLATGRSIERELVQLICCSPPDVSPGDVEVRRQTFADRLNRQAAALFSAKRLDVEFY